MVGGRAPPPHRRFEPDQPGLDDAGVSSDRGADAGGAGVARQAHPERGADRGRGGLPDDPEGLTQPMQRRDFLKIAGGGAAGIGLAAITAVEPARATPASMQEAIRKVVGTAPINPGRVKLELPPLSENGNAVPLTLSVESPMSEVDHVKALHVFTEKNPHPDVVTFRLGPRAGRARVATRIRLADSQTVVAVCELSDGSFWSARADVVVTIAACAEEL